MPAGAPVPPAGIAATAFTAYAATDARYRCDCRHFTSARRIRKALHYGGNTFTRTEYADALVDPIKAAILAVLDPAPDDEYVALPGGFRAMKCTRQNSQAAPMSGKSGWLARASLSTMTSRWA